jgi:hypothetical protein
MHSRAQLNLTTREHTAYISGGKCVASLCCSGREARFNREAVSRLVAWLREGARVINATRSRPVSIRETNHRLYEKSLLFPPVRRSHLIKSSACIG